MKRIDRPEADNIRANVSLTLQQVQTPKYNISKAERRALTELKKDKDIIILPADKGRATVILSKVDYIKKCKEHIESIKWECLKKLKSLKDPNIIDQSLNYKLKPTESPAPRFYRLQKIHKQDQKSLTQEHLFMINCKHPYNLC